MESEKLGAGASSTNENFSAHSRYAEIVARELGYTFRSLDADDYLFEISDGRRHAFFSTGAGSPFALNQANGSSIARDKAFCQTVLDQFGLPTIPSRQFFANSTQASLRSPGREPADAVAYARTADYPMFCKPLAGSQGEFAEAIWSIAEFENYLARVGRHHYAILVQPYIRAREYRAFVLQGHALFCYEKTKPEVIADGVSTISALFAGSTARAVDANGHVYACEETPAAGTRLFMEGPANRATGGSSHSVTEDVPKELAELAVQATGILGLHLAAVDVFELDDGRLLIIEVNSSPAVRTLETHGRWDLIRTIWTANIEAAMALSGGARG